jgi:hypothetical protein
VQRRKQRLARTNLYYGVPSALFSVDEFLSDRDTLRSLMAAEARGEGCVAEFV